MTAPGAPVTVGVMRPVLVPAQWTAGPSSAGAFCPWAPGPAPDKMETAHPQSPESLQAEPDLPPTQDMEEEQEGGHHCQGLPLLKCHRLFPEWQTPTGSLKWGGERTSI